MSMKPMVTCPEDVEHLGWGGNYGADAERFAAVDAYIAREPDLAKRQQADVNASIFGMGEPCEIDPNYDPRKACK